MSSYVNKQVILISRPKNIPEAKNFKVIESVLPKIKTGEVIIQNIFLSVEPAMKGWVSVVSNYADPVALNAVMKSFASGVVVESLHSDYQIGDLVTGMFGWQEYALVKADNIDRKITGSPLPISASLGVAGINGMTAYFGLLDIGNPVSGETVVVSTAAGSVGSCVGQIAKIKGCTTVGITGGQQKVDLCKNLYGYDQILDYKNDNLANTLTEACPKGVDIYFDNTGGPISDEVIQRLNVGARIIICGTASISNWNPVPHGPRIERQILVKRARIQGFLIFDYKDRYEEALSNLTKWIVSGSIKYRENILHGIEKAPDSIAAIYRGENLGKMLIKVS
ncbi:MAG: NADP-dependent oxidoreductase [Porticoccus sp.]|jgi:NADPH-dependent curcumin reductase CurA|nr:NADP-dependent oxidoreductase [Porticoccus sp.]